jgi:hypothetical protein
MLRVRGWVFVLQMVIVARKKVTKGVVTFLGGRPDRTYDSSVESGTQCLRTNKGLRAYLLS